MKQFVDYIKLNYLILIIKLLIIALFILPIVGNYDRIYFDYLFISEQDKGLLHNLFVIIQNTNFRPILIVFIPFIGVFLNRKIGWMLISSFFYFLLSSCVFKFDELDFSNEIFLFIIIITILLSIIFIMNIRRISYLYYGIPKTELLGENVIATIIGMSLTIGVLLLQ
ncbi:hypothetical protein [Tamlana sp. I1]|uniref:hypothetical protein n=1 Tax=Tamlana sp. I1 TaxID=2762061 RepID=UPI001890A1E8|nr:hypothetical protein [Tamlana sp. I1]